MTDETTEQTANDPTVKEPSLLDVIKDFPNAPNQAVIDEWKTRYIDIYFSGFSEKECYIWRALNRGEFRQMQINAQILASKAEPQNQAELEARIKENINTTFAQEEEIVSKCLLWPKLTPEELSFKAGTVTTLLEQIMANSNFVTPQQAQMLVVKI